MKPKFTVQDILDFNPCSDYTEERITELFHQVGCKKYVTVDKLFKVDIPHQDFFWLILRPEFIPEKQLHEIAIWCSEKIALPIWNKYYPDDNRPFEAIRIKKLWLKGKATTEELYTARDAAWDAVAEAVAEEAENAAEAVASAAARAAAREAARAAAWAAVRDVASAAARAAARDAARAGADDARDAVAVTGADDARNKIKKYIEKKIKIKGE